MDAVKRLLRGRSDTPAVEYCLITTIVLIAIIAGIHVLVPA